MDPAPRDAAEDALPQGGTLEDLDMAEAALSAITSSAKTLSRNPFVYRKARPSPFLRGWLIPLGHPGHVALLEIEHIRTVTILAVRHRLEDDDH